MSLPPRPHSKRVMQGPWRCEEVHVVMRPDNENMTSLDRSDCVPQYVAMYCPTIYRVQVRTKVSTMKGGGMKEPALRLQTGKMLAEKCAQML